MNVFHKQADEGSILVLGLGMAIVLVSVITIMVNVTSLWVARSTLNSIADGAALAGAQAIDVQDVYTNGVNSAIKLDSALAKQKVMKYVTAPQVFNQVTELRVIKIEVSKNSVWVTLSATPRVPFGYFLPTDSIVARSRAQGVMLVR